jgi:hypothetical protein
MKKAGVSFDGMAANLKTKVSREAGVPEEGFPLYADISIRTSVMGILHYLEKNP